MSKWYVRTPTQKIFNYTQYILNDVGYKFYSGDKEFFSGETEVIYIDTNTKLLQYSSEDYLCEIDELEKEVLYEDLKEKIKEI